MKMKKVEKGFTLVEILVAICLFGITCAVLFSAILFALKYNKENHYAGEEIQMQMNSAENYNNKQSLFDNKVAPYRFSNGKHKVLLKVNFGSTSDGTGTGHDFSFTNSDVYAYQANAGFEDRTAAYNMRFFDPENANLFDPSAGKWWVRFHNYSSVDLGREVYINNSLGIGMFGKDGNSLGSRYSKLDLSDSTGAVSFQFGLDLSHYTGTDADSIFFVGNWNSDFYNDPTYIPSSSEIEVIASALDSYKESIESEEHPGTYELTGYIDFYYDGEGIYNKTAFKTKHPELSIS